MTTFRNAAIKFENAATRRYERPIDAADHFYDQAVDELIAEGIEEPPEDEIGERITALMNADDYDGNDPEFYR